MLKANEVRIINAVANRSFNKMMLGPLLSGDVVKTNKIPITPKKLTHK